MTDEAGVSRTTTADGLGRLSQVTETGNLSTTYSCDLLGDLIGVNQSGRLRAFGYSAGPADQRHQSRERHHQLHLRQHPTLLNTALVWFA
ncbi:MAG: hypothetical protein LAP40_22290 [Acidobacteriia bacterium]|nr:hypothetical protein [Terriglobia bacterium]